MAKDIEEFCSISVTESYVLICIVNLSNIKFVNNVLSFYTSFAKYFGQNKAHINYKANLLAFQLSKINFLGILASFL